MHDDSSNRRRFLAATTSVAGAVALAGCGSTGNGDGSTDDEPTDDEPTDEESTDEQSTDTDTEDGDDGSTGDDASADDSPEDVSFQAPHGATIEATVYGEGDCGVVLVPQINRDRGSWEPQATTIAEQGHLALAIDEDPDDRASSVRGAIRYLREDADVSTVVLVGASSGGEAVVVANAETDAPVDGTVTLSAGGGADRAGELQGRTLFVVATGDDERFVETARQLHEDAPDPTELVEYDGSAHGQGLFDSPHGDDLQERLATFLEEVCGV